jgi:hypothetical protein
VSAALAGRYLRGWNRGSQGRAASSQLRGPRVGRVEGRRRLLSVAEATLSELPAFVHRTSASAADVVKERSYSPSAVTKPVLFLPRRRTPQRRRPGAVLRRSAVDLLSRRHRRARDDALLDSAPRRLGRPPGDLPSLAPLEGPRALLRDRALANPPTSAVPQPGGARSH